MMLDEIARFLADNDIGIYDDSNECGTIFTGPLPDAPDEAISLFQYAGRQPLSHNLEKVRRPGLQIICRSWSQTDAQQKADLIEELLDQYSGGMYGTYYNMIRAVQAPFFLERDKNDRVLVAQNFYIDRRTPE